MEVLAALQQRVYTVDLETAEVTRRQTGRVVTPFVKKSGRKLIRVYVNGKVKAIHLARLVWMAGSKRTIPKQFEVHHRDEQNDSDGFENLICLHRLDHRKMHANVVEEPVPW
jgi:hypothetical protein